MDTAIFIEKKHSLVNKIEYITLSLQIEQIFQDLYPLI